MNFVEAAKEIEQQYLKKELSGEVAVAALEAMRAASYKEVKRLEKELIELCHQVSDAHRPLRYRRRIVGSEPQRALPKNTPALKS